MPGLFRKFRDELRTVASGAGLAVGVGKLSWGVGVGAAGVVSDHGARRKLWKIWSKVVWYAALAVSGALKWTK